MSSNRQCLSCDGSALLSDEQLPCPESALSPNVRQLITETGIFGANDELDTHHYITDMGLINWDSVGRNLPDEELSSSYYSDCVHIMAPCFSLAEKQLSKLTVERFQMLYGHLCEWTKFKQNWLDVFHLLTSSDNTGSNLPLLITTSCLENSLGDIFLLHGTQCPSLLKDLLASAELETVFGSKVMQILRVVIGPPLSLNLRNVVWHGFPYCGEIPDRYAWFLLLVIPSLGQILHDKNITDIPHRQSVNLSHFSVCGDLFPDVVKEEFMSIIQDSHFVSPRTHTLWKAAVEYFENGKNGFSVVLLFPLLEHGLRRVFSLVNNCPHRTLTAEATTLYTTFDEILQYTLSDGTKNKMAAQLGESYMDLLFDLLVYSDGPRARDRLSHGEIDLYNYPRSLAKALCVVCVAVAARYMPQEKEFILQKGSIQSCIDFCRTYQSVFHPLSLVKQKIRSVTESAAELNMKIVYTHDLQPRSSFQFTEVLNNEDMISYQQMHFDIRCVVEKIHSLWNDCHAVLDFLIAGLMSEFCDGRKIVSVLLDKKISTLYRFQSASDNQEDGAKKLDGNKQSEMVVLLLKITEECRTFLSQTSEMLQLRLDQLASKSLRSRQRDNLQRLIKSCPYQHLVSHLVMYLVIWQLYSLDTVNDHHNDQEFRRHTKFLKTVLQFVENMRTYTSPDKNKWSETADLTITFIQKVRHFVGLN